MAQKRMLDKKISVSDQVANLSRDGMLIFTWAIPHADDLGLLPFSMRTLRAMIVPMLDFQLEDFGKQVEDIVNQGLWRVFEYQGQKFYQIVRFADHQTLKKDRQPQTIMQIEHNKDPKKTWDFVAGLMNLEEVGIQLEETGNQMDTEVKRSEVKGSKAKPLDQTLFDRFWVEYPRKIAKAAALKKWKVIKPSAELAEAIIAAVIKQRETEQWKKDGGQFIPHPATWLNQGRWEDEVSENSASRKVDKF